MDKVYLNNDLYETASHWNELTREQLLKLTELMGDVTNLNEFMVKLWLDMLEFKVLKQREEIIENQVYFYLWKKTEQFKVPHIHTESAYHYVTATIKDKVYLISSQDLHFAASHLRWLFTEKMEGQDIIENTFVLHSRLTKNLIPDLTHNKVKYYGPANALTNLTWAEYIFTETYFSRYEKTKNPKWRDLFFAVIYRQSKTEKEINSNDFNGDKRIPFNPAKTEERVKELKSLSETYKNASLLFYEGCRAFIAKKFPYTFTVGGGSDDDAFQTMNELTITIKNEINEPLDNIRESLLYDMLNILENLAKRRKPDNK